MAQTGKLLFLAILMASSLVIHLVAASSSAESCAPRCQQEANKTTECCSCYQKVLATKLAESDARLVATKAKLLETKAALASNEAELEKTTAEVNTTIDSMRFQAWTSGT